MLESGNHDALMKKQGLYSKLYTMNYSSFDDLPESAEDQAATAVGKAT
jgi:ATP-binding cassette subfamily B protein